MYFGPRKLLSSQVSFHKTTRILFVEKNDDCSSCNYMYCPPQCLSSDNEHHWFPPPPPHPPPSHKNNMPMFLVLMLCVLGAAFIFLFYLTIHRRQRSNLSNSVRRFADGILGFVDENHGPALDHPIWYIRSVGLEQSVIDSIPVFKHKKGDGLVEGTDCSVCLSEFQEDESLRLLPKCNHAFHVACIDTWLGSHINCPLCRSPIVRDVNGTTDITQVNAGQSVLESREDATIDDQRENDENGEDGAIVVRIEGENIGPLWTQQEKMLERSDGIRVLSDLADHRVRIGGELQSVRRSFSLDLSSASRIYAEAAKIQPVKEEGTSSRQEVEVKKQNLDIVAAKLGNNKSSINRSRKSFSFGRSLQSVPIRMKRSFSSGGRSSLHRDSRSQELVRTL